MLAIKKKYLTDDKNRKVAVLISIDDYKKMEEVIENYGLHQLMQGKQEEKPLSVEEAKEYYRKLKKAK